MTTPKRNNKGFFIFIIVGFFAAVILPDMLMKSCQYRPALATLTDGERRAAFDFLGSASKTPEDFLLEQFQSRDVVFLGEFNLYAPPLFVFRQNALFVKQLIPLLYNKGIRCLAIEHALAKDQKEIDAIVTAAEYDQKRVNNILFNWFPLFDYQEYADLFQGAWKVNHERAPGAPAFRIIALNMEIDYQSIFANKAEPSAVAKAYNNTVQEDAMFQVIDREIIAQGRKALVFMNLGFCLKMESPERREFYNQFKIEYHGSPSSLTIGKIGARAGVVLIHNPWIRQDQKIGLPLEGYLDTILLELPQSKQRLGFAIGGSPFAKLPVTTTFVLPGTRDTVFGDLADGYIFLGPLNEYAGPTPIPGYVTAENLEKLKYFLDPETVSQATPEKVQESLVQYAAGITSFAQNLPK